MSTTKRKRTVSTARLERIRKSKDISVPEMLNSMSKVSENHPNLNFQECITQWAEENSYTSSFTAKDPNKDFIKEICPTLDYGGKVERVQTRRGKENEYIATVRLEAGSKSKMWFKFENGKAMWGISGSPAVLGSRDLSEDSSINEDSTNGGVKHEPSSSETAIDNSIDNSYEEDDFEL